MGFTLFNYYQRLNLFNSNSGRRREREEEKHGERGGMLAYYRRKRENEIVEMLTYERRRKRESNREGGCEREGGGMSVKEDGAVKKERKIARRSSPQASFLMPHSTIDWQHMDLWTEVAKHMSGKELVIVSLANRWFNSLFSQGYFWKYAFLQDMKIPVACRVSFPWKEIYASAFIWKRLRSFYLDSPFVLLTQTLSLPNWLPSPGTDLMVSIELFGMCSLNNARTGIWIADAHVVRCPSCNNTCGEVVHVLDARHVELFLEEGYKNGTWQYEDIGYKSIPFPPGVAIGGIFDVTRMWSPSTSQILNANSWTEPPLGYFKAMTGSHAVVVITKLEPNKGNLVRYQVMKDNNGKVVSIRISQHYFNFLIDIF